MLDRHTCQICYLLEIKLLLIVLVVVTKANKKKKKNKMLRAIKKHI